jgi:hypothetical protein
VPIARQVGNTRGDCARGTCGTNALACHKDIAPRPSQAGKCLDDLTLAVAGDPADSDDLSVT